MDKARRTNTLRVMLTEDERARLEAASGRYPVSTWMRSLALDEADRLDRERQEREQDRAQVKALGRDGS